MDRRTFLSLATLSPFGSLRAPAIVPACIPVKTWARVLNILAKPDGPSRLASSFKQSFQVHIDVLGVFDELDPVEDHTVRRHILDGKYGSHVITQADAVLTEVTRQGKTMPSDFHEQLGLLRGLVKRVHG